MNSALGARELPSMPWRRLAVWAGVVVAAFLLVAQLPVVTRVAWIRAMLDLAHIPLGGFLTLAAWMLLGGSAWRAVLLVAVFMGFAEWFQGSVADRTPDAADFLWGLLGALLVPLWCLRWKDDRRASETTLKLTVTILLLAPPVIIKAPAILDGWYGYRSFPLIWDARLDHAAARWVVRGGTLRRIQHGDQPTIIAEPISGSQSLQLVQFPVLGDWSNYETFCMEFRLQAAGDVLLSIRDGRKVKPPQKRFDDRRQLAAGFHSICFDLKRLQRGDPFAPLDISRIRSIHLVLKEPQGPVELQRLMLE